MNRYGSWVWGLFLLLWIEAVFSAITPLEVFGRLPAIEDVALSPDGKQIAFATTDGDNRTIIVQSMFDPKRVKGWHVSDSKLREIRWADGDNLLVVTSSSAKPMELLGGKSEFLLLQICSVSSGKCFNPIEMNTREVILNTIVSMPMLRKINNETFVYVQGLMSANNHFMPTLFRFKIGAGRGLQTISKGNYLSMDWLINSEGEVAASSFYNEQERRWQLNLHQDGKPKSVLAVAADIERPDVSGFSPDGLALWLEMDENGERVRKAVSLHDGSISTLPSEMNRLEDLFMDPRSRIIGGYSETHELDFFDSQRRETWRVIVNRFPQARVDLVTATPDFSKVVVRVESERDGYLLVMFDTDTYQFQGLGNIYTGLTNLAQVRPLTYKAADGFEVSGYITLPPDRLEKNLPLVVLPHGGPQVRDDGSFDWLAQALAAQGYAVLQPNYRGSDLGWTHVSAGFGEWGGKMQTDLSDGVRYLVKQGLVDPKRVCIVGGSYGGYAALAGATIDASAYRCAVSINGVSDLGRFMSWIVEKRGRSNSAAGRYFNRYIGAKDDNDPILKQRSPAQQAAKSAIPILLIHGRDDSVVPFEQSQLMADAAKRVGRPLQLIELKNEDHWLSRGATRLKTLQETVNFLKQNNPPD